MTALLLEHLAEQRVVSFAEPAAAAEMAAERAAAAAGNPDDEDDPAPPPFSHVFFAGVGNGACALSRFGAAHLCASSPRLAPLRAVTRALVASTRSNDMAHQDWLAR